MGLVHSDGSAVSCDSYPIYISTEPDVTIRPGTEAHAVALDLIRASFGIPTEDLKAMFARHARRLKEITDNAISELCIQHGLKVPSPPSNSDEISVEKMTELLQRPGARLHFG